MPRRTRALVTVAGASAWRGLVGFYNSDDPTYAASIAYYALVSLFPFSLLAFALLGWATEDTAARAAVVGFVLQYFPNRSEFITAQLDAFRSADLASGVVGSLGLAWGAFGIFGAITTAVNYAWGADGTQRFWRHKLVSFVMLLLAGLALLLVLLLVSASKVVDAAWFASVLARFPGLGVLGGFTVRYATMGLFIAVVALVYRFVPDAAVGFSDVWLGAVVTGVLWKGALEAFSWYLEDMTAKLTRVNGSMAAAVIFLVWVYLQAVIFLYGVEFTAAYARLRRIDA